MPMSTPTASMRTSLTWPARPGTNSWCTSSEVAYPIPISSGARRGHRASRGHAHVSKAPSTANSLTWAALRTSVPSAAGSRAGTPGRAGRRRGYSSPQTHPRSGRRRRRSAPSMRRRPRCAAGRSRVLSYRSPDSFLRDGGRGAELLGEEAHAQFLQLPPNLGETVEALELAGIRRTHRGLPLGGEFLHGPRVRLIGAGIGGGLLDPELGRLQVAGEVGQPRRRGRCDESGVDEPGDLVLHVRQGGEQRHRGRAGNELLRLPLRREGRGDVAGE